MENPHSADNLRDHAQDVEFGGSMLHDDGLQIMFEAWNSVALRRRLGKSGSPLFYPVGM
tara:strand:- start:118124 stop:118300 length:177 start_codon:yes stop_codon:yes gene_type:complete